MCGKDPYQPVVLPSPVEAVLRRPLKPHAKTVEEVVRKHLRDTSDEPAVLELKALGVIALSTYWRDVTVLRKVRQVLGLQAAHDA